jgi:hypothetical protein
VLNFIVGSQGDTSGNGAYLDTEGDDNGAGLDVSAPTTMVIKQHKMMINAIFARVVRIWYLPTFVLHLNSDQLFFSILMVCNAEIVPTVGYNNINEL